jgi:hypothetical protein
MEMVTDLVITSVTIRYNDLALHFAFKSLGCLFGYVYHFFFTSIFDDSFRTGGAALFVTCESPSPGNSFALDRFIAVLNAPEYGIFFPRGPFRTSECFRD